MTARPSQPRILWVGTRVPWPPADGGRQVAAATLAALAAAGADVTVVTPSSPLSPPPPELEAWHPIAERRPSWAVAAVRAALSGRAVTLTRHAMPRVGTHVADLIARGGIDVVHAEQVHAATAALVAHHAGVPVVLRAHNVESVLWRSGAGRPVGLRTLVRLEGRRLAAGEQALLRRVDAVVALTDEDRVVLQAMAPATPVVHVPPPGPSVRTPGARLAGAPACVWLGSDGWAPNEDGVRWLRTDVWPAIARAVPGAHLHVFGGSPAWSGSAAVTVHPRPAVATVAFADEAVLLLPLRVPAGLRMRVLDAWAHGVPVVASPASLHGLGATPGRDILDADSPAAFAAAVRAIRDQPSLRAALVAAGRTRLAAAHDPAASAAALLAVYQSAIARRARR